MMQRFFIGLGLLAVTGGVALARTSNGNDFALFVSEAEEGSADRKALVDDALTRPHSFRYLQIMELKAQTTEGRKEVVITAFEPASYMDVKFTVSKSVSLQKLAASPISTRGDAIAVTGRIEAVDDKTNTIRLRDVIVRHKDRLSPAVGKELVGEVLPNSVFYSFTNAKEGVSLSYQDRDLLKYRDEIHGKQGPQAWADFLIKKIAERKAARAAAAKKAVTP